MTSRRYTYDELVAELPESSEPCELWNGELFTSATPSFAHQEVALSFYRQLFAWVRARELGKVIAGPIDMVLSPSQVVQPDVAFISRDRLHIVQRVIMGAADLVAEVTSVGSRQRDRVEKRALYKAHGIQEYWIIDPELSTIEVLRLKSGRYAVFLRKQQGETAASSLLPGFEVTLDSVFEAQKNF